MENADKKFLEIIGIILMSIIFILYLNHITDSKKSQDSIIEQNELKIDSLRNVISNLELNQFKYDSTILFLNDSLIILNDKVVLNENKIKDLRKKYNEKIKNISNFSSAELEEFLTNRYK